MAETKQNRPKQTSKPKTPRKPAAKSGQKKRPAKKKQTSWLAVHWPQLTALGLSLLSVLAIFKVGLLGKFFANVMRWCIGGSYQLFLVILLVPLLVVIA